MGEPPKPFVDTLLVIFVIQIVVVALFVWLLWDTRREARERERRGYDRELQLIAVTQTQANQLIAIASTLSRIEQLLEQVIRVRSPNDAK